MKTFEKRGTQIETENANYILTGYGLSMRKKTSLSSLGTLKNEIPAELGSVKYKDLEDMVYRLESTYDEIVDILDIAYIGASTFGCTLLPGMYKNSDINLMLKNLLTDELKVNITKILQKRLGSNLDAKKMKKFSK